MNLPVSKIEVAEQVQSLTILVAKAAQNLQSATSSAQVLEARRGASVAYDASKKAARMMQAKGAHDELIAAAHRAQADALEIEANAKRRLADEYDAAQERGEVVGPHDGAKKRVGDDNAISTVADIGLRRDEIHEARVIRDAEIAQPGIVRETLNRSLEERREPTKADLRRSVEAAVSLNRRGSSQKASNPIRKADPWYDRVIRFRSLCEQIADYDSEIMKVAEYEDLPLVRTRVHREAGKALATLLKFEEATNA